MSRAWAMPSADTFSVPPIGDMVRRHLRGLSVDPFARNQRLATITNDLNPDTSAEFHKDAVSFLSELDVVADVVLFDPPYSPRQISECYQAAGLTASMADTQNARLYADCRRAIRRICRKGTTVLSFGWNSAGMGEGFRLDELLLVCHGGAHNDTICLVETMVEYQEPLITDRRTAPADARSDETKQSEGIDKEHSK